MKVLSFEPSSLLLLSAVSLLLSSLLENVEGHGYMQTPRTRNRFAAEEGGNGPGKPRTEYCPHCLNTKEAHELCGHGNTGSFDVWNDSTGNPMPWISQEIFEEGQTFRVDVELTTNHAGHMELYACNMGRASTKECLESNPLTLVTPANGGPIDAKYPQRGYFSPDYAHTFYYKLPSGLIGDEVLLQWKYITGNSCMSDNYLNPVLGLSDLGWLRANTATCPPLSDTGEGRPEQFWNCAEVTIKPSSPTISPAPTAEPTTKQPTDETEAPTEAPTEAGVGYCNYGHLRERPCDGLVEGGHWCNQSEGYCEGSCSGKWCTNSAPPPPPSPPSSNPVAPPTSNPISQPTKNPVAPPTKSPSSNTMVATTTRYWDCSGGSCGCAYLPFGPGTDSEPAHCYSNAMFDAPNNNPYGATYYGTAAISEALGGGNWLAEGCGKCWKVTGTSDINSVTTTLVLKGTNFCPPGNPLCSNGNPHFDISAPGFDVTEYSFSHTCPEREEEEAEGFAACERWMIDSSNPDELCDCSKFHDPVLRAGCENFLSLKWDNTVVEYEEVNCPNELTRLNCWEENGNGYPQTGIPEFCASNLDSTSPTSNPTIPPTSDPTVSPTNAAPTKSPVSEPTASPSQSPTAFPTSDVTANPTANPTNPPTKSPVSNPTKAPTGGGNYCCSNNFKTCASWLSHFDEAGCTSNSYGWIQEGLNCIARWGDCTNNIDGCCSPGTCKGNQWYSQCL